MNINKLHFIYLVPMDVPVRAENHIKDAAAHMQAWCRWQMGNGKTFTYVFAMYRTSHTANWYTTFDQGNCPYGERFWANAQLDARDYAGARFYMPNDSWVIYLDAVCDEAHGQHAGGASVNGSGICVLHRKDVSSICGEDRDWTLCRGVGGGLHEALHTLGLPHPQAVDFARAVMGTGYTTYPNAILTENDKVTLDHHRFFAAEPFRVKPPICPFNESQIVRAPRPRPLPEPRPVPPTPVPTPTDTKPATT